MRIPTIAAVAFSLTLTAAATGQQTSPQTVTKPPASSTVERSYPGGAAASSRSLQTRTESGNRVVVTETTEVPGSDGKLRPAGETVTETIRGSAGAVQTKQDRFGSDPQGRKTLLETTQSEQQTLPDGTSRTVENTLAPDLNGRLGLSQRQVQETKPVGPNAKQTDTTIYRPGVNEPLREAERIQQTERKVSADLTQSESARSVRDGNGRWQTIETRNQETRTKGPAGRIEEETTLRLDANGALTPAEKKVTQRSTTGGQEQVVTETFSRSPGGLALAERRRSTTTATTGGGRETIEEVEARNPVAPNGPLRVVQRIVETVRSVGPDKWETQRQVFALDGNGRLVPISSEKGNSSGK